MGATVKVSVSNQIRDLDEWVSRAQQGDMTAFEQVVKLTENLARKIAFSVVGHNLIDDVLQESYLLVFRKLKQLKEPGAFNGWLCRLVLHVAYKQLKKYPDTAALPETLESEPQTEHSLNSLVLRQALRRLHRKDRDVLILRELLELSYDEVAFALDLPVGTVRSRLHKARKNLKMRLEMGKQC